MRRRIAVSKQFKKDRKLCEKRGKDTAKLRRTIELLQDGGGLPDQYYDHSLRGELREYRCCHLEGDWLLLYKLTEDTVILWRTGTHSDLLKR